MIKIITILMSPFIAFFPSFSTSQNSIDCNNVKISIVRGDITSQCNADAIVNTANQGLRHGGGVCGAIFTKAGFGLSDECNKILNDFEDKQVPVSIAVITDGYNLNQKIIHIVSPNFNTKNLMQESTLFDKNGKKLLSESYINLLRLADDNGIGQIAVPFLSGGNFCRKSSDKNELANIAIESVVEFCKDNVINDLKEIRFVLYGQEDFDLFARELDNFKD